MSLPGDDAQPKKLLSTHNINGFIIFNSTLDNVIRCLKIQSVEEAKKQWSMLLYQNLYLPLWSSKDRQKVKEILLESEVDLSDVEQSEGSAYDRTLAEVGRLFWTYPFRKLVVLGRQGHGTLGVESTSTFWRLLLGCLF